MAAQQLRQLCCEQAALVAREGAEEDNGEAEGAEAAAREVLDGALRGSVVARLCSCLEDCAASPNAPGGLNTLLYA